jgi:hypothetical protein
VAIIFLIQTNQLKDGIRSGGDIGKSMGLRWFISGRHVGISWGSELGNDQMTNKNATTNQK